MLIPLRRITEIPYGLKRGALETAICSFVRDSRIQDAGVDAGALTQQLMESVARILVLKQYPDTQFWLAEDDGDVVAFVICHPEEKQVDNSKVLWATDAWVCPEYRGKKEIKTWWQLIKEEAKRLQCKHILIPSSRSERAYIRFLGGNMKHYCSILKETL